AYTGGQVIVDGSYVSSDPGVPFVSGASLEFAATFTTGNYQYVGFASNATSAALWVVIGRGTQANNSVYARVSTGGTPTEILLGSDLSGTPHNYKIKWNAGNFEFYVDGILIVPITATISTDMVIVISDYVAGAGTELSVDWIRTTPYVPSGSFISRVFDATLTRTWGEVFWTAEVPEATSLVVSARTGDTPAPDGSWTPFVEVPGSGSVIGLTSRFIQYRADLSTTNTLFTPALRDISFSCTAAGNSAPVVTVHPESQTSCTGSMITFISVAAGSPAPAVYWEYSANGGTSWAVVDGALSGTLMIEAEPANSGYLYRAVWHNDVLPDAVSNPATLTVVPEITAVIEVVDNVLCEGEVAELRLGSVTTGEAPYSLVINGVTYVANGVGTVFASIAIPEYSPTVPFDLTSVTDNNGCIKTGAPVSSVSVTFNPAPAGTVTPLRPSLYA
ncbi:MAG: family 16 glycosylhydrolase, partial [Bacteroidales bacterium]|nr:family 16 glycosylhydrolase [Bacteroidales bacterium]